MTVPSASETAKHTHRVAPFMPEGQEYWEAECVDPKCQYAALAELETELNDATDECMRRARELETVEKERDKLRAAIQSAADRLKQHDHFRLKDGTCGRCMVRDELCRALESSRTEGT